jgi:AbrB family looped-hinge helix DNA binding protein
MTTLTMSENGRILIPAALREALGFKSNTRIFVEVKDGSLVLTSPAQHYARLRTYFDQHLKPHAPQIPGQDSVDEFIAERHAEAAREDAQ